MTGQEALRQAAQRLTEAGVEGAARDARRLFAFAAGIAADRVNLVVQDAVSDDVIARFEAAVAQRAARQPVAQIVGRRAFYGRDFKVTRDTLDPRPETELLVDLALERPFTRVLDLGTGTGAILLSLLAERSGAAGMGTDLSPDALRVASENADCLGVSGRVAFVLSDWFAAVSGTFDLIVSNPPYIAAKEMAALAPEVRDWEPHLALTDGADGLTAYRVIAAGARTHLARGGRLLVEIGAAQGAAVRAIFSAAGLEDIDIHTDLNGRDRVISAA